ncbi:MAG: hypothetical protein SFU98_20785 [Leptospiraceae bacterium]|nr:hypothetical protein [Leptospiraceae bacterium]
MISVSSFLLFETFYPELHFFGDGMYKWNQISDLDISVTKLFSCYYPAKSFDSNFHFLSNSKVITIIDHECYYLYPYSLSLFMYLPVKILGAKAVILVQHILVVLVLYFSFGIALELGLSFIQTISALTLIRFGTSISYACLDLEEHIITTVLFLSACYLSIRYKKYFISGSLVALCFLFRPESIVLSFVFVFAVYLLENKKSSNRMLPIMQSVFGACLVLSIIMALNFLFFKNPLGIKAYDQIHHVSIQERLLGSVTHLFYSKFFITNPIFLQMPILFFLFFFFSQKISRNDIQSFLLFLIVSVPILVLISPPTPTLSLGLRFGMPIYPIMILLVINLFPKIVSFRFRNLIRLIFLLLYLWSILNTGFFLFLSHKFYYEYLKVYTALKKIDSNLLIITDTITFQALSEELNQRKVLLITNDEEISEFIKKNGQTNSISIAGVALNHKKIITGSKNLKLFSEQGSGFIQILSLSKTTE